VATSSTSTSQPRPPGGSLADGLIALAGTPDDASSIPGLLRSITQFAADILPPISYASMTAQSDDSYVTVAMTSEVALAVDEAQYADQAGPCVDALNTAEPVALPRIDATMRWPRFRVAAHRLGLHASLSIPIFAGRGTAIAALNLYSTDSGAMTPLTSAVLAAFDDYDENSPPYEGDGLDPGVRELLRGLSGAFRVRADIQQAIGVIMSTQHTDSATAYTVLRSHAAATASSLTAAAGSIISRAGEQQRPA
jgi:hypothetical protein